MGDYLDTVFFLICTVSFPVVDLAEGLAAARAVYLVLVNIHNQKGSGTSSTYQDYTTLRHLYLCNSLYHYDQIHIKDSFHLVPQLDPYLSISPCSLGSTGIRNRATRIRHLCIWR